MGLILTAHSNHKVFTTNQCFEDMDDSLEPSNVLVWTDWDAIHDDINRLVKMGKIFDVSNVSIQKWNQHF